MNSLVFGLLVTCGSVLAAPSPYSGPQPEPAARPGPRPSALAQPRPSPAGPTPGADPYFYDLIRGEFGYPGFPGYEYPGLPECGYFDYGCSRFPGGYGNPALVEEVRLIEPFRPGCGGIPPYVL